MRRRLTVQVSSPQGEPMGFSVTFSRAFLRHLLLAREMNAAILISLHNLAFYFTLMQGIREAIKAGRLGQYRDEFLSRWKATPEDGQ